MPVEEPRQDGPSGERRISDYLAWLREELIATVLDLSPSAQRTSLVPSGWTPLELLSHVLHMEQRWFVWGFLGEQVAEPWGDWNVPEPWTSDGDGDGGRTRPAARWQVPEKVTADQLADRLRAVGEQTTTVLADHPLSDRAVSGGRFGDDPPTLEWICLHVLVEYARHAGHLDISVELTQG